MERHEPAFAKASAGEPRVSVIVVAYNHREYLKACLGALEAVEYPRDWVRLLLIDNASTDGSADFIRAQLMLSDCKATKGGLTAEFAASKENLGFAGGNNAMIRQAMQGGDDFVYLLNPDTEADPAFLKRAIDTMETDPKIAVVQSLLRLHPETDRVNSWGNEIHFLGFGFAGGESVPVHDPAAASKLTVRDIAYASGAGMLMRVSALRSVGLLNEELFAYHEDLEFSWRMRMAGFRVVLAPDSVVYHKYEFSRSISKWYLMERNRFLVMAWCYAWPTLLLILPALIVMEIGLWLFAFKSGWWKEKARAYAYVLNPKRWPAILATRRAVQALRVVPDRLVTRAFTGRLEFQRMRPTLLTMIANPVFNLYWSIVRLVL